MSAVRTLVRSLALPVVVVAAVGCSSSSDDATTSTTEASTPTSEAAAPGEVDCAKVQTAISSVVALSTQAEQLGQGGGAAAAQQEQFQQVVSEAKAQVKVIDNQARAAGIEPSVLQPYIEHNRQLVALLEQLVEDNDVPAFQQGVAAITTPAFEQSQSEVGAALKAACPTLTDS